MKQLLLVRHGPTSATRAVAFPVDEPLEDEARANAAELGIVVRPSTVVLSSPARRAMQTAAALGLQASPEPRLAECDFGSWSGRRLDDLHLEDPDATMSWMTDAEASPHGGESLRAFMERVAAWLDEEATIDRDVVAFTHGGVVKAAVAHTLAAGVAAFWRIVVEPLSITELRANDGVWSLHSLNQRVA